MKNAIEWIKSNPIVTACAVVALLGIVITGYFYVVAAPNYSAARSEELKQQLQQQNTLRNIPVPLPNEDPNAPPDIHEVVVNQTVVKEVGDIYRQIQTQYEDILLNAKTKNSQSHVGVLLGGSDIWPDANPTQFFDLYVRAAADYKDHFKAVFDKQRRPNRWNMPNMIASSPPTQAELEQLLAQSAFEYISSVGATSATQLTQSQASQFYAEQRMKLMDALNLRARSIHIYAQLPPEEDPFAPQDSVSGTAAPTPQPAFGFEDAFDGGAVSPGSKAPSEYPFRIEPWAYSDQPPTPDQLWEGQVQLWVMRDIMSTIAKFNKVGSNDIKAIGPDGSLRDEPASVMNSPIKRLRKLQTLPGYVGLHNMGAALGGLESSDFATGTGLGASGGTTDLSGGSGLSGTATPSIYPTPPLELAPKQETDRAIENFGITPTGRVSNSVFDVRHSQLSIDIEAAKLPAFIAALQQTNFMTVVKAQITDLDEYEMLREGYVYGYADVVRADLVVESLWFRNWTKDLMPKIVKEKLLIILPAVDPLAQPEEIF